MSPTENIEEAEKAFETNFANRREFNLRNWNEFQRLWFNAEDAKNAEIRGENQAKKTLRPSAFSALFALN